MALRRVEPCALLGSQFGLDCVQPPDYVGERWATVRHAVPACLNERSHRRRHAFRQPRSLAVAGGVGQSSLERRPIRVRKLMCEDLKEHHRVGEHVRRRDVPLVPQNLGRHPPVRADFRSEHVGARDGLVVLGAERHGEPEVGDLGFQVCRQQHVGGLEVSVQDALRVQVFHAAGDSSCHAHEEALGRAARERRAQVPSLAELHDQAVGGRFHHRPQEAHDVDVIQIAQHDHLSLPSIQADLTAPGDLDGDPLAFKVRGVGGARCPGANLVLELKFVEANAELLHERRVLELARGLRRQTARDHARARRRRGGPIPTAEARQPVRPHRPRRSERLRSHPTWRTG